MKRFEVSIVFDGGVAYNPTIVCRTKEQALDEFKQAVERSKKEIVQKHFIIEGYYYYWDLIEVTLYEYFDNDNFETLEYERIER